MHLSVTSVTKESTVLVGRQHLEVTAHQAITVPLALEWLNNFHAQMPLTI